MPYCLQPDACLLQGIQAAGFDAFEGFLDLTDGLVAQGFIMKQAGDPRF